MKKLVFILFVLITSILASDCPSYSCNNIIDEYSGKKLGLTCSLPNMPDLNVSAANIFEVDGTTLKTYWEAQNTVCDVIEWIDIAASKRSLIQGMNVSLQNPETINLIIHHEADIREGSASYLSHNLFLDRDSQGNYDQEYPEEDAESDGNVFSTIMHDMVAHEFFHYLQEKVGPALGKNVVTEGTQLSWIYFA